jgi:hypothetical protein
VWLVLEPVPLAVASPKFQLQLLNAPPFETELSANVIADFSQLSVPIVKSTVGNGKTVTEVVSASLQPLLVL